MYNDKEMIKLFGFPFVFTHGTHVENLTSILKKEELSLSSEVENNKNVKIDWVAVTIYIVQQFLM
jgi:hypothetical protein